MAAKRNYYDILGVPHTAGEDQIKRAYRRLAKQYHPDRNPDDPTAEEKFKEVQQAFSVLRDPKKRAEYDRFGEAAVGEWATDPRGYRVYQWGGGKKINIDDLEDLFSAFGAGGEWASIFDQFFGGFGRGPSAQAHGGATRVSPSPRPQRGADEERTIPLTLEQAVRGAVVTVNLRSGRNGRDERLEVKLPPGVTSGQRIRLAGKGHPGRNGGPPGDFYLVCFIRPHPYFRVEGSDLYVDVPVSVSEAALGAKVEVPTIDGRVTVTIPPGTASGSKLRLKNRGLPRAGTSARGDQYVGVQIVPPNPLSAEQRRLLEELGRTAASDPRAACAWNKEPTRTS